MLSRYLEHIDTRYTNTEARLQLTLSGANPTPLSIPPVEAKDLIFLESVEAAHSSHSFNDRLASILGVTRPPLRLDSQAKYGCLARGEGSAYLRFPTGVGYIEKIWVCRIITLWLTIPRLLLADQRLSSAHYP